MADSSIGLTPFHEIPRHRWSALASSLSSPLSEKEIERIRGLGDSLDIDEVASIYIPLTNLLSRYAKAARQTHADTAAFLGITKPHTPFVIGVAGSVAVGKSTVSRLLRELLSRDPETPNIALVTTDGFLYPNAELTRRGIADRKGFPESYDRRALLRFVTEIKSGAERVFAPVYSHLSYDIIPGDTIEVSRPDILIVEGLNVLQPPTGNLSPCRTCSISQSTSMREQPISNPGTSTGSLRYRPAHSPTSGRFSTDTRRSRASRPSPKRRQSGRPSTNRT